MFESALLLPSVSGVPEYPNKLRVIRGRTMKEAFFSPFLFHACYPELQIVLEIFFCRIAGCPTQSQSAV